jgi:hypothetical protein
VIPNVFSKSSRLVSPYYVMLVSPRLPSASQVWTGWFDTLRLQSIIACKPHSGSNWQPDTIIIWTPQTADSFRREALVKQYLDMSVLQHHCHVKDVTESKGRNSIICLSGRLYCSAYQENPYLCNINRLTIPNTKYPSSTHATVSPGPPLVSMT